LGVSRLAFLAVLFAVVALPASASTPARPGFDTDAQISPNGRWIAFDRYFATNRYEHPPHSLRIVDSEGRTERELVPEGTALQAKWTAGNLLHVTRGQDTFLLNPEDGSRVGPAIPASAFSPDGRWIAYVSGTELWVSSPDGSNARRVAVAPSYVSVGAFSPDSTRLTYVSAGGLSGEGDSSEIVAVDGTGRVYLKEAPVIAPGNWAPDGRSVVFMAQNDNGRYRPPQIYVASADGTRVRRLVQTFAAAPDWSPRGDWIAYIRQVSTRRADRYYLMLVHPDGTGAHRVIRTESATWLSDGRRVLSNGAGACRRAGILEIDVFRRTVKRLTNRCRIDGTAQADNLRGTELRDLLYGLGGDDRITGGGGEDDLHGGSGDDVLLARDRSRDRLDCGPGRDRVVADRRDVIAHDCERVLRR
jgi:Tol biopolymer transport system component